MQHFTGLHVVFNDHAVSIIHLPDKSLSILRTRIVAPWHEKRSLDAGRFAAARAVSIDNRR